MKKLLALIISGVLLTLMVNVVLGARSFPEPQGYVNDFAGLFSEEGRQEMEANLVKLKQQTNVELAVVTLTSLEDDVIENVAVQLFEQWGMGEKGKDNGLVILIAKNERQMRIEVGYGLEPLITDSATGRIIRNQMIPAFKLGDFEAGTQAAITELTALITGEVVYDEADEIDDKESEFPEVLALAGPVFWMLLIYAAAFLSRTKSFYAGGIVGGIAGLILGLLAGGIAWLIVFPIVFSLLGLFLDWLFSRNYKALKKAGRSTSWLSSGGGFFSSGGSSRSSGFGGFGGGRSGGGGSSGGW